MGQVLTNNTNLQFARESSLGVLPGSPDWKTAEPNSTSGVGNQDTFKARAPISAKRQKRKGTRIDRDAGAEMSADLTLDAAMDFTEAFVYANATNNDLLFRAANATGTGYTVPALTAAQAAKLQFTSGGPITLLHAVGYATTGNNSLNSVKPLAANPATSATELTVAGLAVETAPTNAELEVCGIRAEAGDLALSIASNIGTLSSGNNGATNSIDFTTLGLTAGQRIHIGGLLDANRFANSATGADSFGSARVLTIAAGQITVDKMDATLLASDGTNNNAGGTNIPTDILFGRFVRNVSASSSDYAEISYQIEQSYPNLYETEPPTPLANPNGYEYIKGARADTMTLNLPEQDFAGVDFSFIAQEAEAIVDDSGRKTNASTPREPLHTGAINTVGNCVRLRMDDVDDTGLLTDFKALTITVTNNANPEKVLCVEGARYINVGNFEMTVSGAALFNSPTIATRINANTTISFDWMVYADEGAIAYDLPSATVTSGGKTFPVNETVQIDLALDAFEDPILGTSIGVSFFPVYPPAAA